MTVENNNLNINQQPVDLTSEAPEVVLARLEEQEAEQRQRALAEGIRNEEEGAKEDAFVRGNSGEQKITQGEKKSVTYTAPNGDEITDSKNGEILAERIIKHTEESGKVIETVITYADGKPVKKVKKENGNTVETTKYESVTDETYGDVIQITTEKSDMSTVTTLVEEVDENTDFKDDDFWQRTTVQASGEKEVVRITENGIRRLTNDREGVIVRDYDDNSITAFDNGELNEIDRRVVAEAMEGSKYGKAFAEASNKPPIENAISQVTEYMSQVINGNAPEKFEYDKKTLRKLFSELNSPNCKYEKISDSPLRYRIVEKDKDGNEVFNHEIYVVRDPQRIQHVGSFRKGVEDDEYVMFFSSVEGNRQYRFKADGSLICTTESDYSTPNLSTNYYPSGSSTRILKDEHNRVVQGNFYNKNRELLVVQNTEYDSNGDVDYVTQTYTDKINSEKLQNRMFIISDSAKVGKDQPYDQLKYKCVDIKDYDPKTMANPQNFEMKDKDGNVIGMYVYESMRIPETVPIIHNDIVQNTAETVGARAITSMNIDKDGYITQMSLYKGLDNGLSKYEHCSTSDFDKQTKLSAMGVLVNKLENIKSVLESYDENRGLLEASFWIDKLDGLVTGESTGENIQILQSYIDLATELANYSQNKSSAGKIKTAMETVCEKNADAKKRYDESADMPAYERGYYVLTGNIYRNQEEQFIRYSQKEQMAENNLRMLYQNYKENNVLSTKERDLFIDISGSDSKSWEKDFLAFIKEVDEAQESLGDDSSQFSFINTSFGSKYVTKLTDGIFAKSTITRDINNMESRENDKNTIGMIFDLAGMALEFGLIAKGINWVAKLGKAYGIAKSARFARFANITEEFLSSESKWAKVANVANRANMGGLNFGVYDVLDEVGKEIPHNNFDIGKLAHRGAIGYLTGFAAGTLSSVTSEPLMRWINRPQAADAVGAVSEELAKVSEAAEATAKGLKLAKGVETTAKGTELADAITKARMEASVANFSSVRGAVAKGVGFLTEVGTFTLASSTINVFDGAEIEEQLLSYYIGNLENEAKRTDDEAKKAEIEAKIAEIKQEVEGMSKVEMMSAMLNMQGIKTNGLSTTEILCQYAKNEYANQFVGLGKLKLTEQVLGMFLAKGKMPTHVKNGERVKALEFEPVGHGKYIDKADPNRTILTEAEITAKVENAMAFDALDAKLQNRFNKYKKEPLSGEDFAKMIYGENPPVNEYTDFADKLSIKAVDGKYKVTTASGDVLEAKSIEEIVDIYLKEVSYKKWVEEQKELFGDIDVANIKSEPLGSTGTQETTISAKGEKIMTVLDKDGNILIRTKGDDVNDFQVVESAFENMSLPRLVNEYKKANKNGDSAKFAAVTAELAYRGYGIDMNTETGKVTLTEPVPAEKGVSSYIKPYIRQVKSGNYVIEKFKDGDVTVSSCKNRENGNVEIEFLEYPDGHVESVEYEYDGETPVRSKHILPDGKSYDCEITEDGTKVTARDENGNETPANITTDENGNVSVEFLAKPKTTSANSGMMYSTILPIPSFVIRGAVSAYKGAKNIYHKLADGKEANNASSFEIVKNETYQDKYNRIEKFLEDKPEIKKELSDFGRLDIDENNIELIELVLSEPRLHSNKHLFSKITSLLSEQEKDVKYNILKTVLENPQLNSDSKILDNLGNCLNIETLEYSHAIEDFNNILKVDPNILAIPRKLTDMNKVADIVQKYPEHAEVLRNIIESNSHIKLGDGGQYENIDNLVRVLNENKDLEQEITEYVSLYRFSDNKNGMAGDSTNDVGRFVELLRSDKKDAVLQMAKNPKFEQSDIDMILEKYPDKSDLQRALTFINKGYTPNAVLHNMERIGGSESAREILLAETPKYEFIDKTPDETSQETIQNRNSVKSRVEEVAPTEAENLRRTLGDKFYDNIKWEEIFTGEVSADEIKSEVSILNEKSKFFARIGVNENRYGKNIKWADEMYKISQLAKTQILEGASFEEVMESIADDYHSYDVSTMDKPQDRFLSGQRRKYGNLETPFNEGSSYSEYSSRLKEVSIQGTKKITHKYNDDIELTYVTGPKMIHPNAKSADAAMSKVSEIYNENLAPLVQKVAKGEKLSDAEVQQVDDIMSEIYFILGNNAPYRRGSNGICDIFMRSMYNSLGIEKPALKKGVSLDLESFCQTLEDYKQNWSSFFEKGAVVNNGANRPIAKKDYPTLSRIDRVSKGEAGGHANLNPSVFWKVMDTHAQHQVKNYLNTLLESVPKDLPEVDVESVEKYKDFILPDGTIISHNEDRDDGILFWIKDPNGEEHVLPAMSSGNVKRARQLINYMATQPEIKREYIDYAQKEFLSGRKIADILEDIKIQEEQKAEDRREAAAESHMAELSLYQNRPKHITIDENNINISMITLTDAEIAEAKEKGIDEATALENKKLSGIYRLNCEDDVQSNTVEHILHLEQRMISELGLKLEDVATNSTLKDDVDVPYDVPVTLSDGTMVMRRKVQRVDEAVAGNKPYTEPVEIFTVKEPGGIEYNLYVIYTGGKVHLESRNLLKLMKQSLDSGANSGVNPISGPEYDAPLRHTKRNNTDIFGIRGKFADADLAKTAQELLVPTGEVDADGNPKMKLSPEASAMVMEMSKQIHEVAAKSEPDIVEFMEMLGLTSETSVFKDKDGNPQSIAHRPKSVQSLHDKIQNALTDNFKKHPDITLEEAIEDIRDGVGVRTVSKLLETNKDYSDVAQALEKGDAKTAIDLAVEHESAQVFEALLKYLDSVKEGTNKVEITKISNYIGQDGIPYFTERQLNELMTKAHKNGVKMPIVERVRSYAEQEAAKVSGKKLPKSTTQVRYSGYTALQMNFRVKETGFVYEWQYRGALVNNFAEGEHVPYDLRTGKDIIGKNTELKGLYKPMIDILTDKAKMPDPDYQEYESYLTAHYEYLRFKELENILKTSNPEHYAKLEQYGFFATAEPPKLPSKFDPRLRAENLELLHEYAEKIKQEPEKAEELTKEYESKLVQNTPENTTTDSYKAKAKVRKDNRSITIYEATTIFGGTEGALPYTDLLNACIRPDGSISEKLVVEAASLKYNEVLPDTAIELVEQMKTGKLDSVQKQFAELKKQNPEKSGEEIAQMILTGEELGGNDGLTEAGVVTDIARNILNRAKGMFSKEGKEESSYVDDMMDANPGEKVADKLKKEWQQKDLTKDAVSEDVDLFNLNPHAGLDSKSPEVFDEVTNLVLHNKLGSYMEQRYNGTRAFMEDIITTHLDEIKDLAKKYPNDVERFAQGLVHILAQETNMTDTEPTVKIYSGVSSEGQAVLSKGIIRINPDMLTNANEVVQIISHEFTHMLQFRDFVSEQGEKGLRELYSDKTLSPEDNEAKTDYFMRRDYIQKMLETTQVKTQDGTIDNYRSRVYLAEQKATGNAKVGSEAYIEKMNELEAYYVGNNARDGMGSWDADLSAEVSKARRREEIKAKFFDSVQDNGEVSRSGGVNNGVKAPQQKAMSDSEFENLIRSQKIGDDYFGYFKRFNNEQVDELKEFYDKFPEFTLEIINAQVVKNYKGDKINRFKGQDVVTILKMYELEPELTELVVNAKGNKNTKGNFIFEDAEQMKAAVGIAKDIPKDKQDIVSTVLNMKRTGDDAHFDAEGVITVLKSYIKNPEVTERLLAEKSDDSPRFYAGDIENIVEVYNPNTKDLTNRLINSFEERNGVSVPRFYGSAIKSIVEFYQKSNSPEANALIDRIINDKFIDKDGNEVFRFNSSNLQGVMQNFNAKPEQLNKLLVEKAENSEPPTYKYNGFGINHILRLREENPEFAQKCIDADVPFNEIGWYGTLNYDFFKDFNEEQTNFAFDIFKIDPNRGFGTSDYQAQNYIKNLDPKQYELAKFLLINKPKNNYYYAITDAIEFIKYNAAREGKAVEKIANFFDAHRDYSNVANIKIDMDTLIQSEEVFDKINEFEKNCKAQNISESEYKDIEKQIFEMLLTYQNIDKTNLGVKLNNYTELSRLKSEMSPKLKDIANKSGINIDNMISQLSSMIGNKRFVIEVPKEKQQRFNNILANNNPQAENILKTFDFAQYEKTGLPLRYPRQKFNEKVQELLNNLKPEEQSAVLQHFGLNESDFGFDGIPNNKAFKNFDYSQECHNVAEEIRNEINRYTANNEVNTGDKEVDRLLNDLIKGLPEFTALVGKQQHKTHAYSVDIHTLKVLQSAMNDPLYQTLSDKDKTVLKIATLLHDTGKKEGVVDDGHAGMSSDYTSSILQKFNFPQEMKDRIIDIVDNHHWFEAYNTGKATDEDIAVRCRKLGDLNIYKILAKADLENVNPDFQYKVTNTKDKAEFDNYMDIAFSDIENAVNKIYGLSNLVFDTKFVNNGQNFPKMVIEIKEGDTTKQVELNVLDFNKLDDNTDLSQFGFPPGTTKANARFIVHMTHPTEESMDFVQILTSNSVNKSVWSTSMITPNDNYTYMGRQFGFIYDVDLANISEAVSFNSNSGTEKGIEEFKNLLFQDSIKRTMVQESFLSHMKEKGIELSKDEYTQLSRLLSDKKFTTQIKDDIQIGDKTLKAEDVIECLNKSRDEVLTSDKPQHNDPVTKMVQNPDGTWSEIVVFNPRIKGLVAKVESIEDCPAEFVKFANEHNLPIILMKPTDVRTEEYKKDDRNYEPQIGNVKLISDGNSKSAETHQHGEGQAVSDAAVSVGISHVENKKIEMLADGTKRVTEPIKWTTKGGEQLEYTLIREYASGESPMLTYRVVDKDNTVVGEWTGFISKDENGSYLDGYDLWTDRSGRNTSGLGTELKKLIYKDAKDYNCSSINILAAYESHVFHHKMGYKCDITDNYLDPIILTLESIKLKNTIPEFNERIEKVLDNKNIAEINILIDDILSYANSNGLRSADIGMANLKIPMKYEFENSNRAGETRGVNSGVTGQHEGTVSPDRAGVNAAQAKSAEILQAEAELGAVAKGMSKSDVAEIIQACTNPDGTVDNAKYSVAKLFARSKDKEFVLARVNSIQNRDVVAPTQQSVAQTSIPSDFEGKLRQAGHTSFDASEIESLRAEFGEIVEDLALQTVMENGLVKPRFSSSDITLIVKASDKDFRLKLLELKTFDENGQEVFKFSMSDITRINKALKDNPHSDEIRQYIQKELAQNENIDSAKLRAFVGLTDKNTSMDDVRLFGTILKDENINSDFAEIYIQSYKSASPEQQSTIAKMLAENGGKNVESVLNEIIPDIIGRNKVLYIAKNAPELRDIPLGGRDEVLSGTAEQVVNRIDMLKIYLKTHPDANANQKINVLTFKNAFQEAGFDLDYKSIIENDILQYVTGLYGMAQVPQAKDINEAQFYKLQAFSKFSYKDKATFKSNWSYVISTGKRDIGSISDVMKYNINFQERQAMLSTMKLGETTRQILQRTEDISDIEGVKKTIDNISKIAGGITNPVEVAETLNKVGVKNYAEFNRYVENLNFNEIRNTAPRMKSMSDKEILVFCAYHYQKGTTEFTPETLSFTKDFTDFLSTHYVDYENMPDILSACPMTDRNVGTLPQGWEVSDMTESELHTRINNIIDNFNGTRNTDNLQASLSSLLGKSVKVEDLGSGVYGTGYKVEVEGSIPVVLKLFHEKPALDTVHSPLHGKNIETQTGLFLNRNSNDFAHMFFGRICTEQDKDGFIVTQFLDEATTPITTSGRNMDYTIDARDVNKSDGHNIINGKIIDYGFVHITNSSDDTNATFRLFRKKEDKPE